MFYSPLEQFEIIVIHYLVLWNIDFSITNVFLYLVIGLIVFSFLSYLNYTKVSIFLDKWYFWFDQLYLFILSILKQQILNILALKYFILVFNIFLLILLLNFIGLLPYAFTITSQIIQTFQIALSVFFGIIIIGCYNNSYFFLELFIPSNIPFVILPFLVLIEIASYFIRPFSLAVRLFANMLAGHTLLNILAVFAFFIAKKFIIFFWLPFFFIMFIFSLELCIAFVQAYIFVILICIYINDIYATH